MWTLLRVNEVKYSQDTHDDETHKTEPTEPYNNNLSKFPKTSLKIANPKQLFAQTYKPLLTASFHLNKQLNLQSSSTSVNSFLGKGSLE